MRNGRIGLVSAMVLAGTVAAFGCSSSNNGGTGGSGGSSNTGGSAGGSSTGGAGGGSNTGGTAGGAAGSSGNSVTTLDGSKALKSLTAAEAKQLCDDTYTFWGKTIPDATTCKWTGIAYAASSSSPTDAMAQQACTTHETSCTQAGAWKNNAGCSDLGTTCTATVAEYSTCISDEAMAFTQTVNALPMCSAFKMSDTTMISEIEAGSKTPQSCMTLTTKCPEVSPPDPFNQM